MINRQHLAAMTAAWIAGLPGARPFLAALAADKPGTALQAAEEAQAATANELHAAMWAQAAGDVALLAGDAQEAHVAYGKSLQLASGPFTVFLSGRAAARRALCGEDTSPAAYRFWQTPCEPDEWNGHYERIAGRALIFHASAFVDAARDDIRRLSDAAAGADMADWKAIAAAVEHEFDVMDVLHACDELADHVYWHRNDRPAAPAAQRQHGARHRSVGAHACIEAILARRLQHVNALTGGRPDHAPDAGQPCALSTARTAPALRYQERIESAISALSRRDDIGAAALLLPLERLAQPDNAAHPALQCEISYCFYKLRLLQGRQQEAATIYTRYARMVFDLVHMQHVGVKRLVGEAGQQHREYTDDVGVRLPARYRRAYTWMLAHIGQQDLSIKDIADVIGVTQRALQQTFKKCLGDSPTEVMRRLRMEHIHRALIQAKEGSEPIMEIANRFGVGNRTTLATSYRKYYAQAPSQTINSMSLKSGVPMSYGDRVPAP